MSHNSELITNLCFPSNLQQLHAADKEYNVASALLAVGVDSTDENASTAYLRGLFLLSRAMVLMIDRIMNDVPTLFHQASLVIENSIQNPHLKEYLKVFYLVLQVCGSKVCNIQNRRLIFVFIR